MLRMVDTHRHKKHIEEKLPRLGEDLGETLEPLDIFAQMWPLCKNFKRRFYYFYSPFLVLVTLR